MSRQKEDIHPLKALILSHGYDLVGFAKPEVPKTVKDFYDDWIEKGYIANQDYIKKNIERRMSPELVVPGAQTVIMMALCYNTPEAKKPDPAKKYGRVSKYARGKDYHKVSEKKAKELLKALNSLYPENTFRYYVDYGPLAERYFAQKAGLGFIGKNCNLITKEFGSWVFLSGIITDLALPPDTPGINQCGECTKCLSACPTQAFEKAYVLNSKKCISYMTTVEHSTQKEIPKEIKPWVFGCDVCQNACPFNIRAPYTTHEEFSPQEGLDTHLDLKDLEKLNPEEFWEKYKHSPIRNLKKPYRKSISPK